MKKGYFMDTELLLTMLINMNYLQIKTLTKLTEDKETLEEATMIVNESQKLLARIIKEQQEDNDIQFELADKQPEQKSLKNKFWKL